MAGRREREKGVSSGSAGDIAKFVATSKGLIDIGFFPW